MDPITAPLTGRSVRLNVSWVLTEKLFSISVKQQTQTKPGCALAADSGAEGHIRSDFVAKPSSFNVFGVSISFSFPQPSSGIKIRLFVCLNYLVYFLLYPISIGWNVAQRHNRDTANSWEEIRVEYWQGKITLCLLSVCTTHRFVSLRL